MATPEEVWQLLAELVQAQKENEQAQKEARKEYEQARKEYEQARKEAQQEYEQARKEARQEYEQVRKEYEQARKENEQSQKELKEAQKETDRQIKELGKQIGGLGKKFGSFTEGFALPSMDRILRERFGMETVSPRIRSRKNGEEMEIDVLAYANGDRNAAYLVEVKSHPREEAIDQLKRLLQRFPQFFPEHQDKARYGILAAVDLSEDLRQQILAEGLYVARIEDDVFTLDVPENFQPRVW